MPVNAKGEGPVPSGGNGNSGTSPHPSTYSVPRVAAWALWMLAQPARGGGENRCKAAPRLLRAPGLGSRPALRGVKVGERGGWAAVPAASPIRPFSGCRPSSESGARTNLGTRTSELRPRMV